jgi:hypothetical protein
MTSTPRMRAPRSKVEDHGATWPLDDDVLSQFYSLGGWKSSLFGDSHAHRVEGVHFFTRGKVVTSRWLDPSHGGLNLALPQNS